MKILEIDNLCTIAEDDHNKEILKGLSLVINSGEVHVIMGPNGSGKSTLANTIFASPRYIVTDGNIKLCDEDITNLSTDKIAKKGVFMSFQTPEEIPGVSLAQFLKTTKHSITGERPNLYKFTKEVEKTMTELNMKYEYVNREFNVGFSGGEKKKNEILQMKFLRPKYIILDELDSGLDVDSLKIVCKNINEYLRENKDSSLLIITHYPRILEYISPDYVHILKDGSIVKTGDSSLAFEVEKSGYTGINDDAKVDVDE